MAKQSEMLLQIYTDAAKKYVIVADILAVGKRGCVDRYQEYVVALPNQLARERVIAHAGAAVHSRGAGSERKDAHQATCKSVDALDDGLLEA